MNNINNQNQRVFFIDRGDVLFNNDMFYISNDNEYQSVKLTTFNVYTISEPPRLYYQSIINFEMDTDSYFATYDDLSEYYICLSTDDKTILFTNCTNNLDTKNKRIVINSIVYPKIILKNNQ